MHSRRFRIAPNEARGGAYPTSIIVQWFRCTASTLRPRSKPYPTGARTTRRTSPISCFRRRPDHDPLLRRVSANSDATQEGSAGVTSTRFDEFSNSACSSPAGEDHRQRAKPCLNGSTDTGTQSAETALPPSLPGKAARGRWSRKPCHPNTSFRTAHRRACGQLTKRRPQRELGVSMV